MIRSMTGFASISRETGAQKVGVTVKSVNHRFLDVQVKAPAALGGLESRVKAMTQQKLTRGRIDVTIAFELDDASAYQVALNEPLLADLTKMLHHARDKGWVTGELSISDIVRLPQVLEIKHQAIGTGLPDEAVALVETVVADALDALVVMRATEGQFLQRDLDTRLATLMSLVDEIERETRAGQLALGERLRAKLDTLSPDLRADPTALAQEIVRVVARSDIDEELVRLRGHVAHWRALVASDESCGRKLDFLVQELNREINTAGSKAEGPRAPELVVTAKAELERLKEQVQNVE